MSSYKINYPQPLLQGDLIAVSAPSSGVEEGGHFLVNIAKKGLENKGYSVTIGETVWTEQKARSCSIEKRVEELMDFFENKNVRAIIPLWGGQFLMEILPYLDWNRLRELEPKWILGYSDISTLSFAYTIMTGHASAHGPGLLDIAANHLDPLTSKWSEVLGGKPETTFVQSSSDYYQSSWDKAYANPGTGFYVDTPTEWKTLSGNDVEFSGRFLGGYMGTLIHLIGTEYGNVERFADKYAKDEGLIIYLESAGSDSAQIYRTLWQMKMNGWFKNVNGVIFGRPMNCEKIKDHTYVDALKDIFRDLDIPVIYDADIGHLPPQNIIVNGSFGTIRTKGHKGTIEMMFR